MSRPTAPGLVWTKLLDVRRAHLVRQGDHRRAVVPRLGLPARRKPERIALSTVNGPPGVHGRPVRRSGIGPPRRRPSRPVDQFEPDHAVTLFGQPMHVEGFPAQRNEHLCLRSANRGQCSTIMSLWTARCQPICSVAHRCSQNAMAQRPSRHPSSLRPASPEREEGNFVAPHEGQRGPRIVVHCEPVRTARLVAFRFTMACKRWASLATLAGRDRLKASTATVWASTLSR